MFTWGWVGNEYLPPGSTTVEVTLITDGDATVVRLVHKGLPTERHATNTTQVGATTWCVSLWQRVAMTRCPIRSLRTRRSRLAAKVGGVDR